MSETIIANLNKKEFIADFIYSAGYFICGIIFIYWLTEAYLKLKLVYTELSGTNSQILLSWFIPVVNFFKPYNLMIELFTYSKKLLANSNNTNKLKIFLVQIWWPLWLIEKVFYIYKSNLKPDIFDIQANIDFCILNLICILISTLLSVVTISMLANYNTHQNLINSLVEENKN
ncbi:DUF4328 domain-containing protein [Leptospira mtsangambouensis]|uniref:DUF4328 domain-containing protein n=1 Tax=Leptospira mtsangambouensis TaxID=2484912 RepID=UPI001EEA43E0|nr:DUF4328 domain-containing protein [Leptospira mtsangambouensis]MCG6142729.1 DUF4328 domain-containing protein [Leptospira mtsangambouensis]